MRGDLVRQGLGDNCEHGIHRERNSGLAALMWKCFRTLTLSIILLDNEMSFSLTLLWADIVKYINRYARCVSTLLAALGRRCCKYLF